MWIFVTLVGKVCIRVVMISMVQVAKAVDLAHNVVICLMVDVNSRVVGIGVGSRL